MSGERNANARGGDHPYVSPEGHNIVDIKFEDEGSFRLFGEEQPYEEIIKEISAVPGLITHGLLLGVADAVVVAREAGDPLVYELSK